MHSKKIVLLTLFCVFLGQIITTGVAGATQTDAHTVGDVLICSRAPGYSSWADIAQLQNGSLIVAYRTSDTYTHAYDATGRTVLRISNDLGVTQGAEYIVDAGDAGNTLDWRGAGLTDYTYNGHEKLMVLYNSYDAATNAVCYVKIWDITDNTWSNRIQISTNGIYCTGNPIILSNGEVAVPTYDAHGQMFITKSATGGYSEWQEYLIAANQSWMFSEPTIIETTPGTVYMTMRTNKTYMAAVNVADYGETPGTVYVDQTIWLSFGAKFETTRLDAGTIMGVVSNGKGVQTWLSTNNGATWGNNYTVNKNYGGYPNSIISGDTVVTVWSDNLFSPQFSNVYLSYSNIYQITGQLPSAATDPAYNPTATFSRDTNALYANGSTAPSGIPRIEYNRLMIEEGTTNLAPNSLFNDLTSISQVNGYGATLTWTAADNKLQCNNPDGSTAYPKTVMEPVNLTAGHTYTASMTCWLASGTGSALVSLVNNTAGTGYTATPALSATPTRVYFTITASTTETYYWKSTTNLAAGNTIYISQLQIEENWYATSFTPTQRASENVTFPVNGLLSPTMGSIKLNVNATDNRFLNNTKPKYLFTVGDGLTDSIQIYKDTNGKVHTKIIDHTGEVSEIVSNAAISSGFIYYIGVTYNDTALMMYVNSVTQTAIVDPSLPQSLTGNCYIGSLAGTYHADAGISQVFLSNVDRSVLDMTSQSIYDCLNVDSYTSLHLPLTSNLNNLAVAYVSLNLLTRTVYEDCGNIKLSVIRTGAVGAQQTLNYATADSTATSGNDYTGTSGTITFNPAQKTWSRTITIIDRPGIQADKQFTFSISSPSARLIPYDILTSTVTITNKFEADFTASVTSGTAPLTVHFDSSTSVIIPTGIITAYAWDFNNDGIIDSTEANPTYTYGYSVNPYTVKLTVSNDGGSNSITKTDYISVGPSDYEVYTFGNLGELLSAVYLLLLIPLVLLGVFIIKMFSGGDGDPRVLMMIIIVGIALFVGVLFAMKLAGGITGL